MKKMNNWTLFRIAAACLLSTVPVDAVQITINEDSTTRFNYHAYWGDGLGTAIAVDKSVALIGMNGRPYGAEARIEADPILLGLNSVVVEIPVNFSFEVLPVIDPNIPHELMAFPRHRSTAWAPSEVVTVGYYSIDDDLRGATFILGEQLASRVPDGGSLLVPLGLALIGCFWIKRRCA
jgi:hypothetical protein